MPGSPVEFVLLANGTKGAAAVNLIKQVFDSPNVYVFGEILAHPNIQGIASLPEGAALLALLRIMAYGTYEDYIREPNMPELSPQGEKKLRLLTIASMATQNKIIKYSELQAKLEN